MKDILLCTSRTRHRFIRDVRSEPHWVFRSDHAPVLMTLHGNTPQGAQPKTQPRPNPRISFGETNAERESIKQMVCLYLEESLRDLKANSWQNISWPQLYQILKDTQSSGPGSAPIVQGVLVTHRSTIQRIIAEKQAELLRSPESQHSSIRRAAEQQTLRVIRERFNGKLAFLANQARQYLENGDLRAFWVNLNQMKKYAGNKHWAPYERQKLPFSARSFAAHCEQSVFPPVKGEDSIDLGEPHPVRWDINGLITYPEVFAALQDLRNGKASGQDGICPDLLKLGRDQLWDPLLHMFNSYWPVAYGGRGVRLPKE